jgi:hypothetical protein
MRRCEVAAPTIGIRALSFGSVARGESPVDAEALCGGAEFVFERDGINNVCRRNPPGVCRRRRRSSACVAEEEDGGRGRGGAVRRP